MPVTLQALHTNVELGTIFRVGCDVTESLFEWLQKGFKTYVMTAELCQGLSSEVYHLTVPDSLHTSCETVNLRLVHGGLATCAFAMQDYGLAASCSAGIKCLGRHPYGV